MLIKEQDKLPDTTIFIKDDSEIQETTLAAWAKGRRVVLIAVPGAFTPTCSARHLPSFC